MAGQRRFVRLIGNSLLFAVTNGGVSITGTNLTLTGSGGTGGATYYVLSSTNVALPLASWLPVQTKTFATDGTFTNMLPVLSTEPRRVYKLESQ